MMSSRFVVLAVLAVALSGCLFTYMSETSSSSVKPAAAAKDEPAGKEEPAEKVEPGPALQAVLNEKERRISKLKMQLLDFQMKYAQVLRILDDHGIEYFVHAKGGRLEVLPPRIAATVTSVDADGDVIGLSVGREDGVRRNYTFTVYRGDKYVGKVVVDKVEEDHCLGFSKKELQAGVIEKGDQARTRW